MAAEQSADDDSLAPPAKKQGQKLSLNKLLYQLLTGLLRYSSSESADFPDYLDKSDPCFHELRTACDNVTRRL